MENASLVLVFHGSRSPEAAAAARRFCEAVAVATPSPSEAAASAPAPSWESVIPAWLQFGEPTIAQALDGLAARGVRRIVVAPLLVLPGRHLDKDIPEVLSAFRQRHPGCAVTLTDPLAALPEFSRVVAVAARRAADARPDNNG